MTLAPSRELGTRLTLIEDDDVGIPYELAEVCAVPGCLALPEPGSHHIEPRSRTAGPKKWVVIDCFVIPNRCRLCPLHHRQVTGIVGGHLARIVWESHPRGHWRWQKLRQAASFNLDWVDVGPLQGIEGMYSGRNI